MLHTLTADTGREKTTSKSVTWRQRCDPCFLERWKHDKKHGKHMRKMIWLTHGWTSISRWTEICSTGISSFFALRTKPTPQIQQALGQSFATLSWSDSSEANTLQPEEHIACTWLYWALFSRITHLDSFGGFHKCKYPHNSWFMLVYNGKSY